MKTRRTIVGALLALVLVPLIFSVVYSWRASNLVELLIQEDRRLNALWALAGESLPARFNLLERITRKGLSGLSFSTKSRIVSVTLGADLELREYVRKYILRPHCYGAPDISQIDSDACLALALEIEPSAQAEALAFATRLMQSAEKDLERLLEIGHRVASDDALDPSYAELAAVTIAKSVAQTGSTEHLRELLPILEAISNSWAVDQAFQILIEKLQEEENQERAALISETLARMVDNAENPDIIAGAIPGILAVLQSENSSVNLSTLLSDALGALSALQSEQGLDIEKNCRLTAGRVLEDGLSQVLRTHLAGVVTFCARNSSEIGRQIARDSRAEIMESSIPVETLRFARVFAAAAEHSDADAARLVLAKFVEAIDESSELEAMELFTGREDMIWQELLKRMAAEETQAFGRRLLDKLERTNSPPIALAYSRGFGWIVASLDTTSEAEPLIDRFVEWHLSAGWPVHNLTFNIERLEEHITAGHALRIASRLTAAARDTREPNKAFALLGAASALGKKLRQELVADVAEALFQLVDRGPKNDVAILRKAGEPLSKLTDELSDSLLNRGALLLLDGLAESFGSDYFDKLVEYFNELVPNLPSPKKRALIETITGRLEGTKDDQERIALSGTLLAFGEFSSDTIVREALAKWKEVNRSSESPVDCAHAVPLVRREGFHHILELWRWPSCSYLERNEVLRAVASAVRYDPQRGEVNLPGLLMWLRSEGQTYQEDRPGFLRRTWDSCIIFCLVLW